MIMGIDCDNVEYIDKFESLCQSAHIPKPIKNDISSNNHIDIIVFINRKNKHIGEVLNELTDNI